jgi:hypothetical protein
VRPRGRNVRRVVPLCEAAFGPQCSQYQEGEEVAAVFRMLDVEPGARELATFGEITVCRRCGDEQSDHVSVTIALSPGRIADEVGYVIEEWLCSFAVSSGEHHRSHVGAEGNR